MLVDNAQCPIKKRLTMKNVKYFWTNLGPILVKLIVVHIIRPQCCKCQILEDLTNISITGPTITL